jgi:uracil-DNA glycosylase
MTNPLPNVKGKGPASARILIVAEATTADDLWKGYPMAGKMGDFFRRLLHEAGIIGSSCYFANVITTRPKNDDVKSLYTQTKTQAAKLGLTSAIHETWVHPSLLPHIEAIRAEVQRVNPTVIIALGDFSMFALTGIFGSVDTWRGSHLECIGHPATVIPTYSPAFLMKKWECKGFCVRDLQRVRDIAAHPEFYTPPAYQFTIRPTFAQVQATLGSLLAIASSGQDLQLACDVETVARYISCIGIAWSAREALCIPFMTLDGHYWTEDEEIQISFLLKSLLTHPQVKVIGQNFNYDNQHFAKHLGYLPNLDFDTMIAQHVLFPGIPKALDFLSSMYCHWHRYWKDEMDDYSRLPENMEQYWTYNCKDNVVTFEVALVLKELLTHLRRWPQYDFMFEVSLSALRTMLKGMLINQKARSETALRLMTAISEHEALINDLVGFELNVGSPTQMCRFFYEELGLPKQFDRKTKRVTTNAKALEALKQKEPLLGPLIDLIDKKRSLGVFLSTFCLMPLDKDGRMRCSFNACGTETFRFSSSKNAFGNGGNLQNIPKGEEKD